MENNTRRRSSISRPGLNFNNIGSSIPPLIDESLPNTPGVELQDPLDNAHDRPGFDRTVTATTLTKLRDLGEETPETNTMSIRNPERNIYRVIAGCVWVLMTGMSDGALGAILPSIEKYYNVNYAIVSLMWMGTAIGFIMVAFTGHYIDNAIGMRMCVSVAPALYLVMYGLTCSGTKFPVIVVGFWFGGLGGAIGLSQYNILLSKLQNAAHYLGMFHGSYGLGAFMSPLISTAMINQGVTWHYFYFIPLALALFSTLFTLWAFAYCDEDLKPWYSEEVNPEATEMTGAEEERVPQRTDDDKHDFKAAIKDRRTWLICIFIFFYQGAEVSLGGWTVTFLLDYRHGNSESTGYIASGFWGGVMIGRFVLTTLLSRLFTARRAILVLMILIMLLDFCVWFIPNTIAAGVCVSIIGLFIGPIYPLMVSLITKILPRRIKFCSLTLGTAFGSSGGSLVPFSVGMGSEYTGTYILHPIVLSCYTCMFVAWLLLPNIERKGAQTTLLQRLW